MDTIAFTVMGEPEPKGSAKIVPLCHKFPFEVRSYGDLLRRVAVTTDNPRVKTWQKAVGGGARTVLGDVAPSPAAFALKLRFFVVPPQKIPANRGGLPIVSDDVDKLCRAILDALTGIVYVDDQQVLDLDATKRYAATPALARTEITITPIAIGLPFPVTAEEPVHADRSRRHRRSRVATAADSIPW